MRAGNLRFRLSFLFLSFLGVVVRRFLSRSTWVAYLTICLSLLVVSPAAAYIDPASGSLVFQAIVGGLMAAGLAIAIFWQRITYRISSFFRRKK